MYLNQALTDYSTEIEEFKRKYNIKWFVEKQNDYGFFIYSENPIGSLPEPLRILPYWTKSLPVKLPTGWIIKKEFNFYIVLDLSKRIPFDAYMKELESEGMVDYKNHKGSIGFSLATSKPIVNDFITDLHWLIVWASGSWKWVLMRTLFLQMGKYPYSEFYIIDKDNDFWNIKNASKVKFQMDYREIMNPWERFVNFLTYLNILMAARSQKYSKAGCVEWEPYMRKREKEIKELGKTKLEAIPYITILMDEFESFRIVASQVMGWTDEFDKRISGLLNVCRANGIRVIIWTQNTQKTILGSSLSNVTSRCYYKINQNSPDGLEKNPWELVYNNKFSKSWVFYQPKAGIIKPAFMEKEVMDIETFKALDSFPSDYTPWKKAKSVMELLLSVTAWVESQLLDFYKDAFKLLWFKEEEVSEMEKDDSFLTLVALVFFMFKAYDDGTLDNKDLGFVASSSIFSSITLPDGSEIPSIDKDIYSYLNNIQNKKYSWIVKNIKDALFWKIMEKNDETYRIFVLTLWKILRSYYNLTIKKANSSSYLKSIPAEDTNKEQNPFDEI